MAGRRQQASQARDDEDYEAPTAATQEQHAPRGLAAKAFESMSEDEKQRKIAECVRYLLCVSSKKTPFFISDISEHVLGGSKQQGRAAEPVLKAASLELQKIFGLEVVPLPFAESKDQLPTLQVAPQDDVGSKARRQYVVLSGLNPEYNQLIQDESSYPQMGLLLVLLSVILLSQGEMGQEQLWQFLNRLDIDEKAPHPQFGDVGHLIENEFVKQQKYIVKMSRADGDTSKSYYRWGPRAKAEFDPKSVLAFAAEIYGEDAGIWVRQLGLDDEAEQAGQEVVVEESQPEPVTTAVNARSTSRSRR